MNSQIAGVPQSSSSAGMNLMNFRSMLRDPWHVYKRLRHSASVGWSEFHSATFAFCYDDVSRALASTEFTTEHPFRATRRVFGPSILDAPSSDHERVRHVLGRPFRQSQLGVSERQVIQPVVRDILASWSNHDPTVDLVSEFAEVIPMQVLMLLLGLPKDSAEWVRSQVEWIVQYIDLGNLPIAQVNQRCRNLTDLIEQSVILGDLDPDVATIGASLSRAVKDGEMSEREARNNALFLLMSGTATSEAAIANALWLATQDGLTEAIAANEISTAEFVDECLRLEPPVRFTPRFATRDTELGGFPISKGSAIQLCLPSANRDEAVFRKPDQLVLGRKEGTPLTFGRGLHSCVGMLLGRKETVAAVQELTSMFEAKLLSVAHRRPSWTFRKPSSIVVRLRRRAE